jgi:hypothetical protein
MRILRTVLAPAILTIGTVGALVAGPVLALTTTATPISAVALAGLPGTWPGVITQSTPQ